MGPLGPVLGVPLRYLREIETIISFGKTYSAASLAAGGQYQGIARLRGLHLNGVTNIVYNAPITVITVGVNLRSDITNHLANHGFVRGPGDGLFTAKQ